MLTFYKLYHQDWWHEACVHATDPEGKNYIFSYSCSYNDKPESGGLGSSSEATGYKYVAHHDLRAYGL